jgi:hypothetical protein
VTGEAIIISAVMFHIFHFLLCKGGLTFNFFFPNITKITIAMRFQGNEGNEE